MGIFKKIFIAWLFISLFGVTRAQERVTFEVDLIRITDLETFEVEYLKIETTLTYNGSILTDDIGIWTRVSDMQRYEGEEDMFYFNAIDNKEQKCRVWFLFKDKYLEKIGIEYQDLFFTFEHVQNKI